MHNHPNFSGKLMRLDRRVWLVMGVTLLLSMLLLGFKSLGKRNCAALQVTVDGKQETGVAVRKPKTMVQFSVNAASGQAIWNFDDGTGVLKGNRVIHQFVRDGNYRVVAYLPGGCTYEQFVSVRNLSFLNQSASVEIDILEEPVKPKVGDLVHFYGITNVPAKRYEWRLLESSDSAQYGTVAVFHFPNPGTYKVHLKLDNDPRKVRVKMVTIKADIAAEAFPGAGNSDMGGLPSIPAGSAGGENPFEKLEPANTPGVSVPSGGQEQAEGGKTPKKAMDPGTFKDQLIEVIAGAKELSELYPYLDYGESTKVQEEGKPMLVNIGPFCRDMMRRKGAQIEQVQFSLDDKRAIQIIKVKVLEQKKKKGFLGSLFGGKDK
ncbi:hypothetical protein SAMN05444008_10128 [Cnuella takakiae]|uniref:PKD domain-containing protein n=1 Tax=Cnuella takakiae TaxID=1302690 RepID=A0A1M4S977_9BACT|nr:PKD domain-containing protein [Cnuella takakiae]OLY94427.1 hypothetical protein BUE76_23000 [Cnuella takakiae]SHE28754.1 hypothetical protein SAMN05444008_10128 [Cnuella takakiae]